MAALRRQRLSGEGQVLTLRMRRCPLASAHSSLLDLSTSRPIDPLHLLKVSGHWKIASEFYVGYPQ